jgi:tRNA pseudouridine-54 N-methylase
MREIIYYSKNAPTSGNFDQNLMKAGRLDIAIHTIIAAFFLSNKMRQDVKMHLVFDGAPDPTKHIEMMPKPDAEVQLSKKDVAGLIKRLLYKYKKGEKKEVDPGYWIEKKRLDLVLEELEKEGKQIWILDKGGIALRKADISDNAVFLLGDQEGLDRKDLKQFKKKYNTISVGNESYFASQVVVILQNELDLREEAKNPAPIANSNENSQDEENI